MGYITAGLLFTAASQSKFGGGFVETFWFLYFVGSIQAKNNSKIVSLSFESDARRKESVIATCIPWKFYQIREPAAKQSANFCMQFIGKKLKTIKNGGPATPQNTDIRKATPSIINCIP